jgi:MraZ protein
MLFQVGELGYPSIQELFRGRHRNMLFISQYINKIDKKGRISVPAPFRLILTKQGGDSIYACQSFTAKCVEAFGQTRIDAISESIEKLEMFSEEKDAFATTLISSLVELAIDTEGRIKLPEELISYGNFGESVMFVGKGKTFELWQPDNFKTHLEKSRQVALANRSKLV